MKRVFKNLQSDVHLIRNSAALSIMDEIDEMFEHLVNAIIDPRNGGQVGTLVYALEKFDCSSIFSTLVDLVINGNAEVSHEAFCRIKEINGDIDRKMFKKDLKKVKKAIENCNSSNYNYDIMYDLLVLMKKNK